MDILLQHYSWCPQRVTLSSEFSRHCTRVSECYSANKHWVRTGHADSLGHGKKEPDTGHIQ